MTATTARKLYMGLLSLLIIAVIGIVVTNIQSLLGFLHDQQQLLKMHVPPDPKATNLFWRMTIMAIIVYAIYGAAIAGAMFLSSKLARWILAALFGAGTVGLIFQFLILLNPHLVHARALSYFVPPSPLDALGPFSFLQNFLRQSPSAGHALWVIDTIVSLLIFAACLVILNKQMPAKHRGASTATPSPTNGPTQSTPIDRRNSGMAIASLVFGLLSLLSSFAGIGLVFGVLALTFGLTAKKHMRIYPGLTGSGMATAGIVLGAIALAVGIVALVIFGSAVFSFLHLMQ